MSARLHTRKQYSTKRFFKHCDIYATSAVPPRPIPFSVPQRIGLHVIIYIQREGEREREREREVGKRKRLLE
jgi:hypothetical protein